jgi:hypothetical protein
MREERKIFVRLPHKKVNANDETRATNNERKKEDLKLRRTTTTTICLRRVLDVREDETKERALCW